MLLLVVVRKCEGKYPLRWCVRGNRYNGEGIGPSAPGSRAQGPVMVTTAWVWLLLVELGDKGVRDQDGQQ